MIDVVNNDVRGSTGRGGGLLIDGRQVLLIIESSRGIVAGRRVYEGGGEGGGLALDNFFQAGRRQIDASSGDGATAAATDGGR